MALLRTASRVRGGENEMKKKNERDNKHRGVQYVLAALAVFVGCDSPFAALSPWRRWR